HTALDADSNDGWVWIQPPRDTKLFRTLERGGRRPIVRIKVKHGKVCYTEALKVDKFYLAKWEDLAFERQVREDQARERNERPPERPRIVLGTEGETLIYLSAWYRQLLGINATRFPADVELDVKVPWWPCRLFAFYRYSLHHPQFGERVSA